MQTGTNAAVVEMAATAGDVGPGNQDFFPEGKFPPVQAAGREQRSAAAVNDFLSVVVITYVNPD